MTETEIRELETTEVVAPVAEKPPSLGLPQVDQALLFTIEFDDNHVRWSATSRRRGKHSSCQKGLLDFGYGKQKKLQEWFAALQKSLGKYKHEFHVHIAGPEILRRSFLIPVVPKAELESVVRSQARQNFPFDIDKGLFGWRVIDQKEWAGGQKYEVYAQALGEHWHLWLGELFGDWLERISFIGASGQQLEHLLNEIDPEFMSGDSYLIRLRGDLLETGFYHNGHLEFYREVPVESLIETDVAAELQAALGELGATADLERSLQLNDIRIIISDALDYYYGLYGQRQITKVYLSLPTDFRDSALQFAEETVRCEVVDLGAQAQVSKHCALAGVSIDPDQYLPWMSVLPKRKLPSSLINLLPEHLLRRRRETRIVVYALLGLALLVTTLGTLSGLKHLTANVMQTELQQRQVDIATTEQHPILLQLDSFRERIATLEQNLQGYSKQSSADYLTVLKLLSQQSQASLRLNTLELSRRPEPKAVVARVTGEVVGPQERQQGELFAWVAGLNEKPWVRSANVTGKQVNRQMGRERLQFEMELVVQR